MKTICYIAIPIGMMILVVEGALDFAKWLLVEIPKSAVSFVIDYLPNAAHDGRRKENA